jgi:hypothetical protein
MTATPVCSNASAKAALNALLALLNVGGTAGTINIFTGAPEATCETADSGTLLATLTLSTTAFANAVDNGAGGATATANSITGTTASATGTAGHFRAKSSAGTVIIQGTCGTAAADLILSGTLLTSGQSVSISSWTVTLPDGSGTD